MVHRQFRRQVEYRILMKFSRGSVTTKPKEFRPFQQLLFMPIQLGVLPIGTIRLTTD